MKLDISQNNMPIWMLTIYLSLKLNIIIEERILKEINGKFHIMIKLVDMEDLNFEEQKKMLKIISFV